MSKETEVYDDRELQKCFEICSHVIETDHDKELIELGFHCGHTSSQEELSQLKEATRWREVDKELPEEGSVIIACCLPFDFQEAIMMILESDYDFGVLTSFYTHWRPIE